MTEPQPTATHNSLGHIALHAALWFIVLIPSRLVLGPTPQRSASTARQSSANNPQLPPNKSSRASSAGPPENNPDPPESRQTSPTPRCAAPPCATASTSPRQS